MTAAITEREACINDGIDRQNEPHRRLHDQPRDRRPSRYQRRADHLVVGIEDADDESDEVRSQVLALRR